MKNKEEKHDLVKVAGVMVLITVLLTWLIPQGYFSSSAITVGDITRVGIFDFFTYGLLGMYYFTVLVTFLFVMGAFYQVLSKTAGYQRLTSSLANHLKGKTFILVVSFIIAAITAVTNEYFVVICMVPFFITILRKMGYDKLTGFLTTFGSILIGILGSIFSSKIVGMNVQYLSIENNTLLWVKLVIFGLAFIIYNGFTILHLNKVTKKDELILDKFECDEVTENAKIWPIATILSIFAIVTLMAYFPWESVAGVSTFTNALKAITECKIFGTTVFAFILGSVQAFGSWDIFGVQVLMLITTLIIKWTCKINRDEFFTAYGEGFKKVGKEVVVLLLTYLVLEFAVMFPVLPTIIDWFMNLSSKFNIFLGTIAGLFTSLFTVEYQYTLNLIGQYLVSSYGTFTNQIAIMLQSTYGLASMFSPASAVLLIGLAFCGISYKNWMKYIWKFLLIMFAIILVLMLIIC